MTTNEIRLGLQRRATKFMREEADEAARTVPLAFSSEEPVERFWGIEVLGHGEEECDLDWMKSGRAPFLVDHSPRDQVGVVEGAVLEADRKGRAVVRFGKGARAEEVFRDVLDGIRVNISVGYEILDLHLTQKGKDGPDEYRATRWRPLEISLVSVPADMTVGVGRDAEGAKLVRIRNFVSNPMEDPMDPVTTPTPTAVAPIAPAAVDLDKLRTDEAKRQKDITAVAARHQLRALAEKAILAGTSLAEFNGQMLEALAARGADAKPLYASDAELGLSERERKRFSFRNAILAMVPNSGVAAEFERECSNAIAKQLGAPAKGFYVPTDVQEERFSVDVRALQRLARLNGQRDLNVGTGSAGGLFVATDLLAGSFIDLLRNRMKVAELGATYLSGLNGSVAIPKQSGAGTFGWIATEGGNTTESQQTVAQVTMTPKTGGAFTDFTRQLLLQSSLDVEAFVRSDLASIIALGVDRAALHGTGASGQPTGLAVTAGIGSVDHGVNGGAPTWAKVVEFETDVAVGNADVGRLAFLTTPANRGKMKTVEKAANTALFLWDQMPALPGVGMVNGYAAHVSNQVRSDLADGTGTLLSAAFFGNWADLLIGEWGVVDIMVDPYTASISGTIRVVGLVSVDVAVRRVESFSAALDIITV